MSSNLPGNCIQNHLYSLNVFFLAYELRIEDINRKGAKFKQKPEVRTRESSRFCWSSLFRSGSALRLFVNMRQKHVIPSTPFQSENGGVFRWACLGCVAAKMSKCSGSRRCRGTTLDNNCEDWGCCCCSDDGIVTVADRMCCERCAVGESFPFQEELFIYIQGITQDCRLQCLYSGR